MLIITLTILLFGLLNGQLNEVDEMRVREARPLEVSDVEQAVNLVCSDIVLDNIVSFDTSRTNTDLIHFTVDNITSPLTNKVKFTTAGYYYIFVRAIGVTLDKAQPQTLTQVIIHKVSKTTITTAEATDPLIGKPVPITLNFPENSLFAEDIIIFSIPDNNDNVSADKHELPLTELIDYLETSLEVSITFDKAGTYNIWVERKGKSTKQTKPSITVLDSSKSPDAITSTLPLYLTNTTHDVSLSYSTDAVIQSDEIFFSLDDTPSNTLKFSPSTATSPATPPSDAPIKFTSAGEYNIFIKATGETGASKQKTKQIVYAKILDESIVSAVTATDVEINKAAPIKFTHAANTLENGDFIIFSISTNDTVSEDATNNKQITLEQLSFDGIAHTQSVTFEKTGVYNMWIKRGADDAIKQTDRNVTVAKANLNANMIRMSIAVLIGLFLF